MKHPKKYLLRTLAYVFLLVGGGWTAASCSEDDEESSEYANWQQRNEAFFASLRDSLSRTDYTWLRLKKYSLDADAEGLSTDYIYAKVIEQGSGTESPAYTDSVRVAYQGRLIPTATYPEGKVFDGTVYGDYSLATAYTSRQLVSGTIDGYSTALQHMHRGDHWRVYIPSELGYREAGSGSIPGYSTLIFDITLVDFCAPDEQMAPWKSRQRP